MKNAESRYEPNQIIEKIIVPAMFRNGEVWSQGKAALTQVYARRNYRKGMDKLNLSQRPRSTWCKAVIGSLDFHAVGKNIIIRVLRAEGGIEVLDLGIDVSPQTFLKAASAEHADVIFASALMFHAALLEAKLKNLFKKKV